MIMIGTLNINDKFNLCNTFPAPKRDILMQYPVTVCLFSLSPLSDFLILPGFIDFTSDEVVSIITLSSISQATYAVP